MKGFTLIELSIGLVIIGLIVGGVLVGRDLVVAAEIRAQISQFEKYRTAVTTFRTKYNGLPGDITDAQATAFGFAPRGTAPYPHGFSGAGDGNGLIEGVVDVGQAGSTTGGAIGTGEPVLFWNDLTYANGNNVNLIEGSFQPIGVIGYGGDPNVPGISGSALGEWMPPAKLGGGNYIYSWSQNGVNYFGISTVTNLLYGISTTAPGLTVIQAAAIDSKIDDGIPTTGSVIAQYAYYFSPVTSPNSATPGGDNTTCFDTSTNRYSTAPANGNGKNCGLSVKMMQ